MGWLELLWWVVTLGLFRNVRYVEYRPPVLDPEVGDEGVTLQARQNYEISCHGHKPLTWIIPGLNDNSDRQKRSVRFSSHKLYFISQKAWNSIECQRSQLRLRRF